MIEVSKKMLRLSFELIAINLSNKIKQIKNKKTISDKK